MKLFSQGTVGWTLLRPGNSRLDSITVRGQCAADIVSVREKYAGHKLPSRNRMLEMLTVREQLKQSYRQRTVYWAKLKSTC